ncbi:MAG TPA: hypothetical protein VFX96_06230 [Pyrinomonadaceae bacterium]|nr:hypothetical protein [Pyrinomonadaceae bacterium]
MQLIDSFYGCQWRGLIAVVSGALALYFTFVLFPSVTKQYETKRGLIPRLQKAYRADAFKVVLQDWSGVNERAAAIYKWDNLIKLDLAYPLIYASFFAFAYAFARGNERPLRWWDYLLFVVPFVAVLFDYIENGLHFYLLRDVDTRAQVDAANFSATLVLLASALSHLKFLIIAAGILAWPIAALVRLFYYLKGAN